jgi:hypothetical protein
MGNFASTPVPPPAPAPAPTPTPAAVNEMDEDDISEEEDAKVTGDYINEDKLDNGENVYYKKDVNTLPEYVTIVAVSHEDGDYTIRFADGRERSTERDRLFRRAEFKLAKGERVYYKKDESIAPVMVSIIAVSYVDGDYTIRFPDGRERNTIRENLYKPKELNLLPASPAVKSGSPRGTPVGTKEPGKGKIATTNDDDDDSGEDDENEVDSRSALSVGETVFYKKGDSFAVQVVVEAISKVDGNYTIKFSDDKVRHTIRDNLFKLEELNSPQKKTPGHGREKKATKAAKSIVTKGKASNDKEPKEIKTKGNKAKE